MLQKTLLITILIIIIVIFIVVVIIIGLAVNYWENFVSELRGSGLSPGLGLDLVIKIL